MRRLTLSLLLSLITLAVLSSCNLSEQRNVVVSTYPEGAKVYLNDRFAGETPVSRTVANREQLDIYVDKKGYYPIEKTIIPTESFWGWLLWARVDNKSLSLPEDTFVYTLEKLPKGVTPKPRARAPKPAKYPSTPGLY